MFGTDIMKRRGCKYFVPSGSAQQNRRVLLMSITARGNHGGNRGGYSRGNGWGNARGKKKFKFFYKRGAPVCPRELKTI